MEVRCAVASILIMSGSLLRQTVGNGADRRTSLWWMFSLAWRLVERSTQAAYALRWPDSDIQVCIEAYARKPL